MKRLAEFNSPSRALIVAAALAIVIGMTKLAAPLLIPILLAIFVAIISTPLLNWMRRRGVPKWMALGLIGFILFDIGSLLALLTTGALEGFRESMPTYQERFLMLSQEFGGWMERLGVGGSTEAVPDLLDPNKVMAGVRMLLSNASGFFMTMLLVVLLVVFILLEVRTMPGKLRAAFGITPEGEARIAQLLRAINHYMRIKTLTSLATAVSVYLLLLVVGIDFAPLWAVLAFFLNFVPVVGNIVMMIPATLLAIVQADVPTAVVVAAGYLAINTVIGNVIEPRVMGKGLGISTLAVFIALLFWGWLLGPVGMFLAVPLTASLIIALDASAHTRPLAILLGPAIAETPEAVKPLGETVDDMARPGEVMQEGVDPR
ncbi:hypothetical protein CKO25_08080 [Thiocapsa imhoffii]|uniref:AI-2E family transporter n=1 Tax=Thiocapsa imhoffii TaxID=382777 RepID=A0A9X0WH47_9GAMM|nr:AI-2E family transporter [Thiocapsa imhoffii]MBK1644607.1 hypothetical protein [Thiocapsa imhoffii]